jgi:hypothetical protein
VKNKSSDSPKIYHSWSACSIIAGTLKRNVHVIMPKGGWKLLPTMYTLLVGRPGIGKGLAMNEALDILKEANTCNIVSGKLTMPYLLDVLHKGFQPALTANASGSITINANVDHTAFMHSSELSVFMNAYKDTIETLTDLWDSAEVFMTGSRQWAGKVINRPSLNLLGGSAPEWLAKSIPADAVGGGFTRRVNFVYANAKETPVPTNGHNYTKVRDNLVQTLQQISNLRGAFTISPRVMPLYDKYYQAAEPDEFDDAAASGYITSKPAHAMKLAMVHSAASRDSLEILEDDWNRAVEMVEEAQEGARRVFRAIGTSNFVIASDKILRYLEHKLNNPAPTHQATRQELMKILWQDINGTGELDMIMEMLIEAGLARQIQAGRHIVYETTIQLKNKRGVTP